MPDDINNNEFDERSDGWAKTLATLALVISILASVVAYSAYNRSMDAIDKANQKLQSVDSSSGDGSKQEGLMQGTEQAPVLPPTQAGEGQ